MAAPTLIGDLIYFEGGTYDIVPFSIDAFGGGAPPTITEQVAAVADKCILVVGLLITSTKTAFEFRSGTTAISGSMAVQVGDVALSASYPTAYMICSIGEALNIAVTVGGAGEKVGGFGCYALVD